MNKYLKFIIIAASVMAVACSKESGQEIADEQRGTINVCIDGEINGYSADEDTKAVAETIIRIKWKGTDTDANEYVYAFDANECLGKLETSIEGTNGLYAKLTGTIKNTSASKITLVYSPQFNGQPTITDRKILLDLSRQSGANVPFLVYGVLDKTSALNNAKVDFTLATSVYKCNCADLPLEGSYVQARIGKVNTVCELTINNGGAPTVNGTTPGKITRYLAGLNLPDQPDQRAIFQIALPISDSEASRKIEVTKGEKIVKAAFSKTAFASAKAYNSVFMFEAYPAIFGEFTVADPDGVPNSGDEKKVHFSKGNLQATIDASGNPTAWKFATNQYDCLGVGGANETIGTKAGDVDLFGWSTENNNFGISMSADNNDYSGNFIDWGENIGDGNTWRTLTGAEWTYLFNERSASTVSGEPDARYAKAKVNSKAGVILLPDSYTHPDGVSPLTNINTDDALYDVNSYDVSAWTKLESAGAVFLPAAGYRYYYVGLVGSDGYYWSSAAYGDSYAYRVAFDSRGVDLNSSNRNRGFSVRLITESN